MLDGQLEVGAVWRVALAGGDRTGAVIAAQDFVRAAAVSGAGIRRWLVSAGIQTERFEGGELVAGAGPPVGRKSDQVWDQLEDAGESDNGVMEYWSDGVVE